MKTHIENPKLAKDGFLVDCIMNMGINLQKLIML